jgi:hypothetical protein
MRDYILLIKVSKWVRRSIALGDLQPVLLQMGGGAPLKLNPGSAAYCARHGIQMIQQSFAVKKTIWRFSSAIRTSNRFLIRQ